MTDIDLSALDRELKKGAAELRLSVLEARPRHGYELGKLIETQSEGAWCSTSTRSIRCCIASRSVA